MQRNHDILSGILPALLALVCLLTTAPATAQVNYGISGNTAYVAGSPGASGDIVIASTFNGYPVTSIRDYALLQRTGLTRVTIPASVTSIGGGAFLNCTNLTNVTFLGNPPVLYADLEVGGVTQFVNIGAGAKAYYYCGTTGWGATYGGLPTVMLCAQQVNYAVSGNTAYVASSPNASGDIVIASTYNGFPVTSIQNYAFENSTGLTGVTIPSSVTSIGSLAFNRCRNLASVIIPEGVTSIGALVFRDCTDLTSLTFPASITNFGGNTFSGCTSLTNLSVDAANPRYSSFNGALFDKAQTTLLVCPAGRAGSFVIPDSVTRVGITLYSGPNPGEFSGCARLTNVIMGSSVTNIGFAAFFGCSNLTRLTIPASVINIGSSAFYNCRSLTNFTFLGNAPRLVSDIEAGAAHFVGVGAGAKVYYFCGTTGWGATYGLPTVMLCPPQIGPGSAGVKPGGFGFTLTRLTNQTVVEASIDLLNWQPIWTNTQPGASAEFLDPQALPNRFYRARPN